MSIDSHRNGDEPTALGHLRIIELGDTPASYCAGFLGGLGADVVKVEPPGGDPNRRLPPFASDIEDPERSLTFINANTNKRSVVLDLVNVAADRESFVSLLATADIFVEATPPGYLEGLGFTDERLLAINTGLITVSLTPFGRTGLYSAFRGSEAIAMAMSGLMYVQGDDTKPPVPAPCHQAYQMAAIQGAYLALAALRHRRRTGTGQRIDISLQEAITYSATANISRYAQRGEIVARRGAEGGAGSNIFRCKDGRYIQTSIVLLPQWRALVKEWMEDPILSQPEWNDRQFRTDNADVANAIIGEFVAQFTADEFCDEAQPRHVPTTPLNTPGEFMESAQIRERDWFQMLDHPVIGAYRAPGPPFRMSVTPMRVRRPAPLLGQHQQEVLGEIAALQRRPAPVGASADGIHSPMLEGIRIVDLTRHFAGPIGTMFLGYHGAEVIKAESANLPVNRDSSGVNFAEYNRNKLSCTIDARRPQGKELLRQLVVQSDILVDNFGAGVIDRLGCAYHELRQLKPEIIQIVMPGMGLTGPLRSWVTYGTNILSYSGLQALWGYPDAPMEARAKIVLADYIGAALFGLASLAAIEYRDRTGEGQFIEICQLEGQGALLGPAILDYTVNGREWEAMGYREVLGAPYAPYGCYPCKGDDAWIVIACETDEQWRSLVRLMGEPTWASDLHCATHANRRENWEALDRNLADWTKEFTPMQNLRRLQVAGVPAGIAMTGEDLYRDPHLRARGHLVEFDHPVWGRLTYPGLPGIPSHSQATATGLAPWIGDHNAYVFGDLLGMTEAQIRELEDAGAIQ